MTIEEAKRDYPLLWEELKRFMPRAWDGDVAELVERIVSICPACWGTRMPCTCMRDE